MLPIFKIRGILFFWHVCVRVAKFNVGHKNLNCRTVMCIPNRKTFSNIPKYMALTFDLFCSEYIVK